MSAYGDRLSAEGNGARVCRPSGARRSVGKIQGLRARFARPYPWLPSVRAFGALRCGNYKLSAVITTKRRLTSLVDDAHVVLVNLQTLDSPPARRASSWTTS